MAPPRWPENRSKHPMADRNNAQSHLSEIVRVRYPDDHEAAEISMREAFDAEETATYTEEAEREEHYRIYIEGI